MSETPKKQFKVPSKVEDGLRKGVFTVGSFLEKLIDKAEGLASNFKQPSVSTQAVLSLEGQLTIPKLKEIINSAYEKATAPKVPSLVDKTAIEIKEGGAALTKVFKEKGATVAAHIDMGGSAGSYGQPEKGVVSIRCIPSKLPFEDGFFDYIIGHFANQFQGDLSKSVKEFSRVLSISGEGIITDFHPFGMYAKRGTIRLKPVESVIRGVEDYYKLCTSVGLKVVSVRESFFDETTRPLFVTEDEKSAFRIVRDTPFLIHLSVRKGGG